MTQSEAFERDPGHWLRRLAPEEWLAAALAEHAKAEAAAALHDGQALVAGVKRAVGMALNAVLIVRPRDSWGRTYVEHVAGLAADARAPEVVRAAAQRVRDAVPPSSGLIALRSRKGDEALLEAGRTVMAHAYAVVHGGKTREET